LAQKGGSAGVHPIVIARGLAFNGGHRNFPILNDDVLMKKARSRSSAEYLAALPPAHDYSTLRNGSRNWAGGLFAQALHLLKVAHRATGVPFGTGTSACAEIPFQP